MRLCDDSSIQHYRPFFSQKFNYLAHRKPHHIGIGPLNASDQKTSEALDSIGAGFVRRFSGSNIPVDFFKAQFFKLHIRFNGF